MAKSTTTLLVMAFPCPQYVHTTKLLKRARVAKPKPNNTRSTFGLSFIALPKILSFLSFGSYGHFKQRHKGARQARDGTCLGLWTEKRVTADFLRPPSRNQYSRCVHPVISSCPLYERLGESMSMPYWTAILTILPRSKLAGFALW